jgi:Cys-tRNA(Pro)/Cys-tRNA(Cys) deacylase
MKKTNAARYLDSLKIDYKLVEYEVDESDLSAESVARKVNLPLDQVFKTLVARGDKTGALMAR